MSKTYVTCIFFFYSFDYNTTMVLLGKIFFSQTRLHHSYRQNNKYATCVNFFLHFMFWSYQASCPEGVSDLSLPHMLYLLAISWIYCCLCYFSCNLDNVVNCDSINQYSKQQTCKEEFRCKKKRNKWVGNSDFMFPHHFLIDLLLRVRTQEYFKTYY